MGVLSIQATPLVKAAYKFSLLTSSVVSIKIWKLAQNDVLQTQQDTQLPDPDIF